MILLKLLLVPGLVAVVTLAVRRWGPLVGGWLAGLPIVAGPVLVFYALEQGNAFAARAAGATLAGLIATVAFAVVYGLGAPRARWYVCVPVGWAVFVAAITLLHALEPLSLMPSMMALFLATLLGRKAIRHSGAGYPRPRDPALQAGSIQHDLAARVVATAVLVVTLTGLADRLGPAWSGLLNAFPVLTTIVAAFSHAQRGASAAVAFLTGYLQAIVGFGLFCVVMAVTLEPLGLGRSIVLALAAQLAWHGLVISRTPSATLPEA